MSEFTQSLGFITGVMALALFVGMLAGEQFLYVSLWLILGSMVLLNQDKIPLRRE